MKKSVTALAAGLIVIAALLVAFYMIGRNIETSGQQEQRGTMSEDFGTYARMEYDGKTYIRKNNLTSILVMGVDQEA